MFTRLKKRLGYLSYLLGGAIRTWRANTGGDGVFSFAQYGEDIVLAAIFEDQPAGRYVDIGAHHPVRFSNTYQLYLKGWTGINVDPTPGSMEVFRKVRPRDVGIECGIGEAEGECILHVFNAPMLNTFDAAQAKIYEQDPRFECIRKAPVRMTTLRGLLREQDVPRDFELLSVDAEGMDLAVLRSNDWGTHRPKCIAVEVAGHTADERQNSAIAQFLGEQGYKLSYVGVKTCVFEEMEWARRVRTL